MKQSSLDDRNSYNNDKASSYRNNPMFRERYDAAFHLQDGIIKMSDTKLQRLYNRKVNATQSIDKDKDNIHINTSVQKLMQWVENFCIRYFDV